MDDQVLNRTQKLKPGAQLPCALFRAVYVLISFKAAKNGRGGVQASRDEIMPVLVPMTSASA